MTEPSLSREYRGRARDDAREEDQALRRQGYAPVWSQALALWGQQVGDQREIPTRTLRPRVSLCRRLVFYIRGSLCEQVRQLRLCVIKTVSTICLIAHKFQFTWFSVCGPAHRGLGSTEQNRTWSDKKAPVRTLGD